MSRIGKLPIKIPSNVEVTLKDGLVSVKGPKGELSLTVDPLITITKNEDMINLRPVSLEKDEDWKKIPKKSSAIWGLSRALVFNMFEGVTEGYQKKLEMEGVGYRAQVAGKILTLSLGFSHPVEFNIPDGVTVIVEGNVITVSGIDKQMVGQAAAKIRSFRKPEPYKGKGIHYEGEHIRRKSGKKAAA
ncbi:MAG: 50S ribosomal protein L6 [Candidatus Spechtbacteria bacterium RIFCSPHIGHO2_02_FULL_43_15b]|uniref:Large ribosomal subunit protein uL6 n=1 Tax=Candidatus Spechtbacteria bacterium RIFCSPHIGHO2_01_FULL_43_30 TaxID=1802158 RepID=A0A1G2H8W9_9BACT|nr:MAG: 50S ribosomal protein L6 [Candidatus Spechtbacteria bacterium RIFCSPHIGHO2_01_FULL_43_30]OGZ59702.1 MAG: 50S ribosomal protein L6 [Candidatus Spechtbacteria bacterium RIFCSPHIGHO2_02_FULL_43_15b]